MTLQDVVRKINPFSGYNPTPRVNYAAGMAAPAPIQSRPSYDLTGLGYTYGSFYHIPLRQDLLLLKRLREAIPLLDVAIVWLRLLIGEPQIEADEALKDDLDAFLETLPVNRIQIGYCNWLATHIDNALMYGRAHAEIIPNNSRDDIFGLVEVAPLMTALRPTKDQYNLDVVQYAAGGGTPITLDQERLITTVFDVRDDDPNGTSLLFGIPLIAEVYEKMVKNLGKAWERYGVPAIYAAWEQPDNFDDPNGDQTKAIMGGVRGQLDAIAQARANGNTQDLAIAGKWQLGVLGAQDAMMDFPSSEQRLMEQICAKTKLPPFLFGLQWATTERMSTTQAILLNEVIEGYQAALTPGLTKFIQMRLDLQGIRGEFKLSWEHTSLQDRMEEARADQMEAVATETEIENALSLWRLGINSAEDVARKFKPELEGMTDAEVRAKLPKLLEEPPEEVPTAIPFGAGLGASGKPTGQMPPSGPAAPSGNGPLRKALEELIGNGNGHG